MRRGSPGASSEDIMKRVDDLDVKYNVFNASKDITKAILKLEDCAFGEDDVRDAIKMALVATHHEGLLDK
jgi:hypothetical protein